MFVAKARVQFAGDLLFAERLPFVGSANRINAYGTDLLMEQKAFRERMP